MSVEDPSGLWVRCTWEIWEKKITISHPELSELLGDVSKAIAEPLQINQDKDYPNRRCYYGMTLVEGALRHLKVVVEYQSGLFRKPAGLIISAHTRVSVSPGEVQIWP